MAKGKTNKQLNNTNTMKQKKREYLRTRSGVMEGKKSQNQKPKIIRETK